MRSNQALYRQLYRIRRFEETVLDKFPTSVFSGTTHTYLGQEANAVGVLHHLQDGDIVFSNHRGHGHFLTYSGDMRALFAELMGKATGVCAGRGGSQHLQWGDFYSNGIQGGIVPVATGMALAEKQLQTGAVVVAFLGDGTLGQGVVYESFNFASLWKIPILYVLEDNQIAQTTPCDLALAGEMKARFVAFGIPVQELDTSDVLEISTAAEGLLDQIRTRGGPRALILHTCRFGPHSKGDDTRDRELVAALQHQRDPLRIHAARLDPEPRATIEADVEAEVHAAFEQALADPLPDPGQDLSLNISRTPAPELEPLPPADTVLESLNAALHETMKTDERVVLLGEDILDPYGGAFKVTKGLSEAFSQRVMTTPISEAGMVGLAAGMALRGLRPVVEIMFGDFVTLIADQLVNHIAKFRWMYKDQVRVPVVIRTPMGGRRGYGPTHSQTLEKLYLGVPGLRTLAPTAMGNPGRLLAAAIADENPVLFIENKLLYLSPLQDADSLAEFDLIRLETPNSYAPTYALRVRGAPPPTLTLAAYGHMAELARQAVRKLAYEHEIFVELVVPTQLAPFELEPLFAAVRRTRRLLVAEEGTLTLGWGAEILARTQETLGAKLTAARRVAAVDAPIPASPPLEEAILPGVEDIVTAAQKVLEN
jgi:2-oxoisovalerate dehydrogenase E1 component